MVGFLIVVILFVVLVGGGWSIGKWIGELLFGDMDKNSDITIIERKTIIHQHYHDNRSINVDGEEFKNNLKK